MTLTQIRTSIPWLMAATRAALGPVLIAGAAANWNGATLAGIVLTALLSDIFDGILARRWLCDTPAVRLFDTIADTIFYLCTGIALWLSHPAILRQVSLLLGSVVAMELGHFVFDFAKFGKPASYHSYLAKFWGLVLAAAVIYSFAFGSASWPLAIALWVGIACKLEGLLLSAILPFWQRDVTTIPAALRLRIAYLAPTNPSVPHSSRFCDEWERRTPTARPPAPRQPPLIQATNTQT